VGHKASAGHTVGTGHGAVRAPCEVGAGVRRGRPDANPCPDVRALAFLYLLQCTTHVHVVITLCLTPLTKLHYSRRDYYAACTIYGHMETIRKMNEQTKQ
jgi:hypothetical protein